MIEKSWIRQALLRCTVLRHLAVSAEASLGLAKLTRKFPKICWAKSWLVSYLKVKILYLDPNWPWKWLEYSNRANGQLEQYRFYSQPLNPLPLLWPEKKSHLFLCLWIFWKGEKKWGVFSVLLKDNFGQSSETKTFWNETLKLVFSFPVFWNKWKFLFREVYLKTH